MMEIRTYKILILIVLFIGCNDSHYTSKMTYGNWNIITLTDKGKSIINSDGYQKGYTRYPPMYIEKKINQITIEISRNEDFYSNFRISKKGDSIVLIMNNSTLKQFDGIYSINFKKKNNLGPGDYLILESGNIKIEAVRKGFR